MIKLKELLNEIEEECWDTHKQVGMKEKGERMVPNCVIKEGLEDTSWENNGKKNNITTAFRCYKKLSCCTSSN